MALNQNTTILAQLPLRQIGGEPGTLRSMWGRAERMNQSVGQGIPSKLAGIPSGNLAPSSWVLPYKPGRMSSRAAILTITAAADGTRGLKATGAASFSFDASAVGGLIVSATGSAAFSIVTNNPFLRATVGGTGAASLSINASAAIGAIANLTGVASFNFSASAPAYAIGHMTGEATSNTPLSPQSLAAAVRESLESGTPIPVDAQRINGAEVIGDGTTGNAWRGVGVSP
jgi:hypothetical protein